MALGIPMALLLSGAMSAGGGILGGLLGKSKQQEWEPRYLQLPDYEEATGARKSWWDTLQQWGKEPGYGAIPMNWDDIWQTAKDKISRYYWGGVNDPGLVGKMRANAARRGTTLSDAALASLGFQEKIDLSDLATTQATQKAEYGEKGRTNWLNALMSLAGIKPSFVTSAGVAQSQYGTGEMIGDVSSGIGSLFSQYAQQKQQEDWMNKLFDMYSGNKMPSTSSPYVSAGSAWKGYKSPVTGLDPGIRVPSNMYD